MSKPLTPPLSVKPCAQCTSGRAVGFRRLCEECRKYNYTKSHGQYVTNRREIQELKARIEKLEAMLAGSRVRRMAVSSREDV